jgi:PiT family inorganic phosphate transporter
MQAGLIVVVVLVCASIFVNGWTDAPNAITTVVSTRVLSPKAAVGLAAVFNLAGVLLMGTAVAATIGGMIQLTPGTDALVTLAAAQIAIVSWAVGAWKFGIPTSESHALIAGLTGAALAGGGISIVSWEAWQKVLWGLGISSVLGFVTGWLATVGVSKAFGRMTRKTANKFFSYGQIVSASAMAFSHGAQDGQKFMGVLAFALMMGGVIPATGTFSIPIWLMVGCSLVMACGTSIGGYRIIKTMGMDMVKIEKYQGFSSEVAASACMLVSTVFGIPLSTTNTKGTALMGAAAARRLSNVNWGIVKEMVLAWVLTFPACGLIGYLMALLLHAIFKA